MNLNITMGQYYPVDSFVHRLDPRTKILLTILMIVAVFMVHSLVGYALVLAFLYWAAKCSNVPFKMLMKGIKPLRIILILTFVLNLFFSNGTTPLIDWWIIHITREGLTQAVHYSLRLVFLVLATSLMTLTTSPIALSDGIELLLSPLKRFHFPAHELAMMMSIALRFIPTLMEEADKIMKAQMARGADFETGNLFARAKAMIPLLVPLFVSAFRRAGELAMAMEARCYHGGENRTRLRKLEITKNDYLAYGAVLALMLLIVLEGVVVSHIGGNPLMARRILLTIEYDGTAYSGWQRQYNGLAVQQLIEEALTRATGEAIAITGASRTDAGVHALGQCAHFDTSSRIPPEKYPFVLNTMLPRDIRVQAGREVPDGFHARFMTCGKRYTYRILNSRHGSAIRRNTFAHVPIPLDVDAMRQALPTLLGTHDFAAYQASGGTAKTTIRTIRMAEMTAQGDEIILLVEGDAFLYNMVRIIAGTLIEIGLHRRSADAFTEAFRTLDRLSLGVTAPPHGLELTKVYYPEEAFRMPEAVRWHEE